MRRVRGFSIVELVVVMAIMAILVTLAFVGVSASQVNARNAKRKADVDAIARGLEVRYKQGNPRATESNGATNAGSYPGINEWFHVVGFDKGSTWNPTIIAGGYTLDEYPGTNNDNFQPPTSDKGSGFNIICVWTGCQDSGGNPYKAGNTTMLTNAMGANNDNYVYEPVDPNGYTCPNGGCVAFNLYYHLEGDAAGVYQVVRSKHQ